MIMFDSKGGLHKNRKDIEKDERYYRKWELCLNTNPNCIDTEEEAIQGADVLIALSKPGPGTVKREWVRSMGPKSIVFACANPVPEIWPYAAKEEGAYIVATGRGDFPNQVNNSICFPGLLKGALLVRARKITDTMAIRCAHSIADYAKSRGITTENIIATMEETEVFAREAAEVAMTAIEEGVARISDTWENIYSKAKKDILESRALTQDLMKDGHIPQLPEEMLKETLDYAISEVRKTQ